MKLRVVVSRYGFFNSLLGENVFITARHVVENRKITKVATTVPSIDISFGSYLPSQASQIEGPFFHPNPNYDLAALRIPSSLSNYPVLRLTIHAATFSEQDSQAG